MSFEIPVCFSGTGMYVPECVVKNDYFASYLDTSDEWIVSRTGIKERRRAAPDESTSTLAAHAARAALSDAGLSATDLDAIVVATATGDHPFPATASIVQGNIGALGVPSFDVAAACAGFLYGAAVGANFIGSGMYEKVLVIGAEVLTRYADPQDRSIVVLLGDAAGAAVLTKAPDDKQRILYCHLGTDGTRADHICLPAGGSKLRPSATTIAERMHYMKMKGREVYKFAVVKMQELIDDALRATGLTPNDLKLVIPHQSNLRIIESVREKMGLPLEKMSVNIDRFGNTSAASIPIGLHEARKNGVLQTGDIVLMIGLGAGLSWGTMVVQM